MLPRVKISALQAYLLIVGSAAVADHVIGIPALIRSAGRDSWISVLLGGAMASLPVLALASLGRRFPGKTLVQFMPDILGRYIGIPLAFLYLGYFFLVLVITLRTFIEFIATAFMLDTPPIIFGLAITLVAVYAARSGLEVFSRVIQILVPLIFLIGFAIAFILYPLKDYRQLLPVLAHGFRPVWDGVIPVLGFLGEMVVFAMVQPHFQDQSRLRLVDLLALGSLIILMIGSATGSLAIFGVAEASRLGFPAFHVVRSVAIYDFLERIDFAAIFFWMTGVYARISLYYYVTALGAAQLFRLKEYTPLVLPLGVTVLALSMLTFDNVVQVFKFVEMPYAVINIIMGMILPLFLLAVAAIRRGSDQSGTGSKGSGQTGE